MPWTYIAEIQDLEPGLSDVGYRVVTSDYIEDENGAAITGSILTPFTTTGVAETIKNRSGVYRASITIEPDEARVEWFSANGDEFENPEAAIKPTVAAPDFTQDDRDTINAVLSTVEGFGAGQIIVTNPVISIEGDEAVVVRGGDYLQRDGRALKFNITGACASWSVDHFKFIVNDEETLVVTPTHESIEGGYRLWVEFTRDETRMLRWSSVPFYIEAVLTNTDELPAGEGTLYIKQGGE